VLSSSKDMVLSYAPKFCSNIEHWLQSSNTTYGLNNLVSATYVCSTYDLKNMVSNMCVCNTYDLKNTLCQWTDIDGWKGSDGR